MGYLYANIVSIINAMRRAGVESVLIKYQVFGTFISVDGPFITWRNNSVLLVTELCDAIDLVQFWMPINTTPTSSIKDEFDFSHAILSPFLFKTSVDRVCNQIKRYATRSGHVDNGKGIGSFNINSDGTAFMEYEPQAYNAAIKRVWECNINTKYEDD